MAESWGIVLNRKVARLDESIPRLGASGLAVVKTWARHTNPGLVGLLYCAWAVARSVAARTLVIVACALADSTLSPLASQPERCGLRSQEDFLGGAGGAVRSSAQTCL